MNKVLIMNVIFVFFITVVVLGIYYKKEKNEKIKSHLKKFIVFIILSTPIVMCEILKIKLNKFYVIFTFILLFYNLRKD